MNIKNKIFLAALLTSITFSSFAQKLPNPNFSLKTPETAEIIEVEITANSTILRVSIENLIEGGYFCLDRNSYLVTPAGDKLKLTGLAGLPFCPLTHKFSSIGEKVYFSMTFPPLPSGTEWFNIIEECGEMCLTVYGVTLSSQINSQVNRGFMALDSGNNAEAIKTFEELLIDLRQINHALLGSVYINLVTLYKNEGEIKKAENLASEMKSSSIPMKELFLKNLSRLGY